MNDHILISVLIGVHNGEQYIKKTIESIISQTHQNFEIIVILNCSSDKTAAILENFKDNRIIIYKTNICQLAFNLNFGLMHAKGDYIARIDSDDVAEPIRLAKQLNYILNNNIDVIGSNIELIDENDKVIGNKYYPEKDLDIRKKIYYANPLAHPSIMYKKSVILKNSGYMNGKVSEDYDLWIRLMRDKSIKFYNIQENLTKYRIHTNQARGNKLAYYEICGYMIRESLYQKSFKFLIGFFISIFKGFVK